MPAFTPAQRTAYRRQRKYGRRYLLPAGAGSIPAVTYPQTRLTNRVWIALGADLTASHLTWNWLNITERVRHKAGIAVEFGRRNEATHVTTTTAQLQVDNRDGWLSRRNPHSPYYGLLGGKVANVPIWIEVNPGSGFVDQYRGYINELPLGWDKSGNNATISLECSGILRRLESTEDLDNSLNRTILADNPVAYWRMDDPAGSTRFESSLPTGGIPLIEVALPVNEGVQYATVDAPPGGSDAAADFSQGAFVTTYAGTPGINLPPPWTVVFSIKRPADGSADGIGVVAVYYDVDGVEQSSGFGVTEDTEVSERDWYHVLIEGTQNGPNWQIYRWRNGLDKGINYSGVGTLGNLNDIIASVDILVGISEISIGYIGVYAGTGIDPQVHSDALQAFAGELGHIRFLRIAAQLGIPAHCQASTSAPMGPQPSGTGLEVLRDIEITDGGTMYERDYGLGYQALSERYNAPVRMELDFAQKHISGTPKPADDDQRFRNQWTLRSSSTGASRTVRDADYSATLEGLHPDGGTINSYTNDQLSIAAGWRVRRDTVDEDRWPQLPVNMGRTPELIPEWLTVGVGDRIQALNPPTQVAPDAIDGIVEGGAKRWNTVDWEGYLNVGPASIYQVGIAGDSTTNGAWAQTSDAEYAEDIDDTETSIEVTSTDTWTTTPAGQLIVFGGEVCSLDAVSGSAPNWTFTVTRSVNGVVKSHSLTSPAHLRAVRVYRPAVAVY